MPVGHRDRGLQPGHHGAWRRSCGRPENHGRQRAGRLRPAPSDPRGEQRGAGAEGVRSAAERTHRAHGHRPGLAPGHPPTCDRAAPAWPGFAARPSAHRHLLDAGPAPLRPRQGEVFGRCGHVLTHRGPRPHHADPRRKRHRDARLRQRAYPLTSALVDGGAMSTAPSWPGAGPRTHRDRATVHVLTPALGDRERTRQSIATRRQLRSMLCR